jgi:hypothetical protein
VANSILRRVRDLGGTAIVDSRPGAGMSLELSVPKKPQVPQKPSEPRKEVLS